LCQLHYGQWRLARKKNESRDDEAKQEIPPFEYEGDEAALIALVEQQEREQQAKDLKGEKNE